MNLVNSRRQLPAAHCDLKGLDKPLERSSGGMLTKRIGVETTISTVKSYDWRLWRKLGSLPGETIAAKLSAKTRESACPIPMLSY
ncbi:MAG: hypothetical protein JSR89_05055 [Proteobacteria bacterium]|nr:hypothetical protein [Pseudomonadota bacterium]